MSPFAAHRDRLVALARRVLGTAADAEDVVHDAFVATFEADRADVRSPDAWLTRVVRNAAIDRARRRAAERRALALLGIDAEGASDAPGDWLASEAVLRRLVARLDPASVAFVLLREVFDFEYAELARASGRSQAACRQALHRALARLRESARNAGPAERERTQGDDEALLALCTRALATGDPGPLLAVVTPPATALATPGPATSVRSRAARQPGAAAACAVGVASASPAPPLAAEGAAACAGTRLALVNGRYVLALVLGDVVLCAVPAGVDASTAGDAIVGEALAS